MNKNRFVIDTKRERLIYEKINIEGAIKDFTKFKNTLSDKKLRKEMSKKIEVLSIRLSQLNRVFSIMGIKCNEI